MGVTPNRSAPGGCMIIWILRFDNNRLTIADFRDVHLLAVSLRLMTRLCPLQAFLMPAYRDNPVGVGRVRTEVLFNFWYVVKRTLLCGLAPRRRVIIRLSSHVGRMSRRPAWKNRLTTASPKTCISGLYSSIIIYWFVRD